MIGIGKHTNDEELKINDTIQENALEVQALSLSINLTDLDLHGIVYYDHEFGSLVINPSGNKVAYIAEKKKDKNVPFFPTSKVIL